MRPEHRPPPLMALGNRRIALTSEEIEEAGARPPAGWKLLPDLDVWVDPGALEMFE